MTSTFNLKSLFLYIGMGAIIAVSTVSCKDDPVPAPVTPNVVQLAQSDTTLSLLVTLVTKAGLANALSTTNNITVFAPTNAAFRAAGYTDAVINALTNDQAAANFSAVLTYHVVPLRVLSSAVPASDTVKTLDGKNIYASKNANGVFVNGITVRPDGVDLNASNGVVHKINGVLIPPTKTIAQIVIDNPNLFSVLLAAVQRADLTAALSGSGKFTVFAPTNAAFGATPYSTADLITAAPADAVRTIVQAHVIGTNVFASDLINNSTAPTINGGTPAQTLTIGTTPPSVKISGSANPASQIATTTPGATFNIVATNGVVHVIDRVLLP